MVTTDTKEFIQTDILPTAITRIRQNAVRYGEQFPSYGQGTEQYNLTPNQNWLASFWAGLLWLTYAHTRHPADKERAAQRLASFRTRLTQQIRLNHDIGFLFTLSARAQYQLTGDTDARQLALKAADVLYQRFRPVGEYIQAWGDLDDDDESGRLIIDCMMNLPLLLWASDQTGESRYRDAALAHANTTRQYLLRADGSTYHTFFLNPDDGTPIGGKTHQGYADESLWARGQGWAVYGFAALAQWVDDDSYRQAAIQAANCYLREAPLTQVAPYDLRLPDEAPRPPDSSADAIVAGGLLRLAAVTGDDTYERHAVQLIEMLYKQAFDTRDNAEGLLLHGTQHAPHDYGVDTYTIFGDYFFLETAMKLTDAATDFWTPTDATE